MRTRDAVGVEPAPSAPADARAPGWDAEVVEALIRELWALRQALLEHQARLAPWLDAAEPSRRPSAVNLAHYLALRRVDLRPLQERLAALGLSSLGRAETHVLANVDKVLGILHRLAGRPWTPLSGDEPAGFRRGPALLARQATALFGAAPRERGVRIMVTLPSEAAHDEALVTGLVAAGMDIARINCAHDGPAEWMAMADRVRDAAQRARRPLRVLMDLGGPKLRTGPVAGGPPVLKLKPERDAWGRVVAAARLGLCAAGTPQAAAQALAGRAPCLAVDAGWLERVRVGDRLALVDARGARRQWRVVERQEAGVVVEGEATAYLAEDTVLQLRRHGRSRASTRLAGLPASPGRLLLRRGDLLDVLPQGLGCGPQPGAPGRRARPARIACTLPEALAAVRAGERIWFDDGRIGGVVRRASARGLRVEITDAREGGEHLAADKGINLPDTALALPALSAQDLDDLAVVARHADLVGLSFAQSAADVRLLRERLVALDAAQVGLVLKIETRRGFAHLPEMLLAAMAGPAAGVMIARGDLAVECGYERLAEVQEEILWACEAAHMPVVWATQVLETLARTGLPSRAEITDAAMGGRAECVMLNKGPHILEAMRTLDDILCRMQAHQAKKRPLLRALTAWERMGPPPAPARPEAPAAGSAYSGADRPASSRR